jgi:hypothetical protein
MAHGSRLKAQGSRLNRDDRTADTGAVLICQNCHGPVTFSVAGWSHLDRDTDCPGLVIAWPPPGTADDEEDAA